MDLCIFETYFFEKENCIIAILSHHLDYFFFFIKSFFISYLSRPTRNLYKVLFVLKTYIQLLCNVHSYVDIYSNFLVVPEFNTIVLVCTKVKVKMFYRNFESVLFLKSLRESYVI